MGLGSSVARVTHVSEAATSHYRHGDEVADTWFKEFLASFGDASVQEVFPIARASLSDPIQNSLIHIKEPSYIRYIIILNAFGVCRRLYRG